MSTEQDRENYYLSLNDDGVLAHEEFLLHSNDFIDGENIVKYKSVNEFEYKIREYLNDKDECIRIGKNGYEHTKKYHTGRARVEYMLKVMEGIPWQEA